MRESAGCIGSMSCIRSAGCIGSMGWIGSMGCIWLIGLTTLNFVYRYKDCFIILHGQKESEVCSHVVYPNHSRRSKRTL